MVNQKIIRGKKRSIPGGGGGDRGKKRSLEGEVTGSKEPENGNEKQIK